MPYQPYLAPVVALIAGILILIQPALLSIIVAVYLIAIGILGLMGRGPGMVWSMILSPRPSGCRHRGGAANPGNHRVKLPYIQAEPFSSGVPCTAQFSPKEIVMSIESARAFVARMRKDAEFKRQILATESAAKRKEIIKNAGFDFERMHLELFGEQLPPEERDAFDALMILKNFRFAAKLIGGYLHPYQLFKSTDVSTQGEGSFTVRQPAGDAFDRPV